MLAATQATAAFVPGTMSDPPCALRLRARCLPAPYPSKSCSPDDYKACSFIPQAPQGIKQITMRSAALRLVPGFQVSDLAPLGAEIQTFPQNRNAGTAMIAGEDCPSSRHYPAMVRNALGLSERAEFSDNLACYFVCPCKVRGRE